MTKDEYALQLALSPSVTLFCLLIGIHWYLAIVFGFGAFILVDIFRDLNKGNSK